MAPAQYNGVAYSPCRKIWPTRDSGIVRLRPTVTTSGEVKSIAYAQQMSDRREERAFICAVDWLV